jgi:hypothetical protein
MSTPTMQEVILIRTSDDGKQTLGAMTIKGTDFKCKTIERPWKNNENMISCIPKGSYFVKWTPSPRLKRSTYEVMEVPGRAGIRIHPANYAQELHGCIALGSAHKDLNMDGLNDVVHSGNTVKEFETLMKEKSFVLRII